MSKTRILFIVIIVLGFLFGGTFLINSFELPREKTVSQREQPTSAPEPTAESDFMKGPSPVISRINKPLSTRTPEQKKPLKEVEILLDTTTFSAGSAVRFTIRNGLSVPVYYEYFPGWCAGELVGIYQKQTGKFHYVKRRDQTCEVAPFIREIQPEQKIISTISSSEVNTFMLPGIYQLKFTYSREKISQSQFGKPEYTFSEEITINP